MLEDLSFAMPIHPFTGLCAIGLRRNGEPVWPVLGGAEVDDETDEGNAADDQGDDKLKPEDETNTLEYWKKRSRQHERKAKTWASLAQEFGDDLDADKVRQALLRKDAVKPTEGDDDLAQARQQAVADAIANAKKDADSKANERIIKSELRAAATGKLANPKIALQLIDLSQFEVDEDGNIEEEDLNDAIAELLKKEPYLAAQGRKFQGDPDAGPRGKTAEGKPAQVTEDQLSKMSPEEIVVAQKEGRLADLLGG